jgi:hypothetical protein
MYGLTFHPGCLSDLLLIQDGILRDAMHVVNFFEYKPITQNPFNRSIRQGRPQAEPGVMTYLRANRILKELSVLSPAFLKPFAAMRHRYGTTLPDILKRKGVVI